jgi:hypothetical protein
MALFQKKDDVFPRIVSDQSSGPTTSDRIFSPQIQIHRIVELYGLTDEERNFIFDSINECIRLHKKHAGVDNA